MKPGNLISVIFIFISTFLHYTSFSQAYFPYDKFNGTNLKWTHDLQFNASDTTIIMITVREKL